MAKQLFAAFTLPSPGSTLDAWHLPTEAAAGIYLLETFCNGIWRGTFCLEGNGWLCPSVAA